MNHITRLNDNPELPFVRYKVKGRGEKLKEAIKETLHKERIELTTSPHYEKHIFFNRNENEKVGIVFTDNGIRYNNKSVEWKGDVISEVLEYIYTQF